jgi:hypothetical protein
LIGIPQAIGVHVVNRPSEIITTGPVSIETYV